MTPIEIWRPVQGYEGLYEVSNLGRVKSLDRAVNNNGGVYIRPERLLRPSKGEYLQVILCKEGITTTYRIHRLVAISFPEICGEYYEGAEVDHINGNAVDNRAVNLRITDHRTNMLNPYTRERFNETIKRRKALCS